MSYFEEFCISNLCEKHYLKVVNHILHDIKFIYRCKITASKNKPRELEAATFREKATLEVSRASNIRVYLVKLL